MGYRSDIRIMIKERDREEFDKIIDKYELEPDSIKRYKYTGYDLPSHSLPLVEYRFNNRKWYDGYEDVDEVNKFIQEHQSAYICIGEEWDDVTNECTLYDDNGNLVSFSPYYIERKIALNKWCFDEIDEDGLINPFTYIDEKGDVI